MAVVLSALVVPRHGLRAAVAADPVAEPTVSWSEQCVRYVTYVLREQALDVRFGRPDEAQVIGLRPVARPSGFETRIDQLEAELFPVLTTRLLGSRLTIGDVVESQLAEVRRGCGLNWNAPGR